MGEFSDRGTGRLREYNIRSTILVLFISGRESRACFFLDPCISDNAPHQNAGSVVSPSQDYVDTVNRITRWDPPVVDAPAPSAVSGGGHGAMSSEPPQGLVQGAPVAEPPSKIDRSTSSSKGRASRRTRFIREMSKPQRRLVSKQDSEPGDHTPGVIPAPSGGTLSYSSEGRGGGSSAASAGRRAGAHAGQL